MNEDEILAALKAHVAREQAAGTNHHPEPQPDASHASALLNDPDVPPPSDPSAARPIFGAPAPALPNTATVDCRKIDLVSAEVSALQNTVGQLNPRSPGFLNAIAQTIKKMVSRSLSWYTRSLRAFHSSVAQALKVQGYAINSLQGQVVSIHNQIALVQNHLTSFQDQVSDEISSDRSQLRSIQASLASIHDELTQFKNDFPSVIDTKFKSLHGQLQKALEVADHAIREQQGPYVPLFHGLSPVVDIGCGRGEFLELLKEAGIAAYGVDSDPIACEAARRKALKVVEGDLFEHLRQLPDRCLAGVFSARVVEYLPPHLVPELIALCSHKLKPGGVIVIETTNPGSDSPFGRTFHLDASHFRPVYPEVMKSMLDSNDFLESKICFLAPREVPSVATAGSSASDNRKSEEDTLPLAEGALRSPTYNVIARRR